MAPPETLARRWRKLKKRCSFSSSDRLVRSKSFTEQDVLKTADYDGERIPVGGGDGGPDGVGERDKYLTVGARDVNKFAGLREKISQWNHDLKKRRSSSENLANLAGTLPRPRRQQKQQHDGSRHNNEVIDDDMFVVVTPQRRQGGYVRSALVVSANTNANNSTTTTTKETPVRRPMMMAPSPRNSTPIKHPSSTGVERKDTSLWSSPSPSPPASDHSSSDFSQDNQRSNSSYSSSSSSQHGLHHNLYQDQDSGYDGFCPEKSIYSTGSSETSSLLSSEGQPESHQQQQSTPPPSQPAAVVHLKTQSPQEIYAKPRARPRPSPIYEKHSDYRISPPVPQPRGSLMNSIGHYSSLDPAAVYGGLDSPYGSVLTTTPPRAKIAQATVINLVKTRSLSPEGSPPPPPLPPRPSAHEQTAAPASLPPLPNPKPRSRQIVHGAVSLPRKRVDFQERARRRGSYHERDTVDSPTIGGSAIAANTPENSLQSIEKVN